MRIGLAMSGGGVRGLAHVGVVQALREHGLHPHHFCGASAGALVGLMAAADCSIEDMLDFWMESKPFHFGRVALAGGLFHTESYREELARFVPYETFEALPRRLSIAVTAMLAGELEIVDTGPIFPIVLASACFPLVFSPVHHDDEVFMDGGIIENFPVAPVADTCELVIGVDVAPHHAYTADQLDHVKGVVERIMDLGYRGNAEANAALCDVLICPPGIEEFSAFQTSAMLDVYQLGYAAGVAAIPEIESKLAALAQQKE